jgi:diguanylate cyclase (GGDEF)-like protein
LHEKLKTGGRFAATCQRWRHDAVQDLFNILLVDDDPTVIGLLGSMLQECGRLRFATSGADALRMARQSVPDLVLLDIEMPGMSGFEVCTAMKETPLLMDVPIIFITGHDDADHEVTGLAMGATDFIVKPPRAAQVVARVRMHLRVKQLTDALRNAAYIDGLTGIANRRQFEETIHREWLRAQRVGSPLSLLMIDIDAFKSYNDHYGHQAGDRCLQAVAQSLKHAVHRPADLSARYGGEEFAVLLPDTDACGARFLALHLLQAVDVMRLPHANSPASDHVTVSIGVSAFEDFALPRDAQPLQHLQVSVLVAAADQALYAAKAGGRHQARFLGVHDLGMSDRAVDLRLHHDELVPGAAAPAP